MVDLSFFLFGSAFDMSVWCHLIQINKYCIVSFSNLVLVTISDSRLMPTSHSIHISPVVFLDHKNAGLVLGFPLVPHYTI